MAEALLCRIVPQGAARSCRIIPQLASRPSRLKPIGLLWQEKVNHMMCIVRRDRLDLFNEFCSKFDESSGVVVIFDRRIGERRRQSARPSTDRRQQTDRRQYYTELRLLGWAMVRDHDAAAIALSAGSSI